MQVCITDALDFISSWHNTIGNKVFIQPYNQRRDALVFSFDGELKPFLNYTKGYHRHRAKRPYLDTTPRVMSDIRKLLRPYRTLGGRVFIDSSRAYYVDSNLKEHHLCDLIWPAGLDVVTVVKNLRPRPKPTLFLTATYRR